MISAEIMDGSGIEESHFEHPPSQWLGRYTWETHWTLRCPVARGKVSGACRAKVTSCRRNVHRAAPSWPGWPLLFWPHPPFLTVLCYKDNSIGTMNITVNSYLIGFPNYLNFLTKS